MKLLTKDIENKLIKNNTEVEDPLCLVKFFNAGGTGTWYAISYNPEERKFYEYVSIFEDWNDELGYFTLDELESFRGRFGLGIERDLHYTPEKLSTITARSYKK